MSGPTDRCRPQRRSTSSAPARGFTLIEMAVTIALVAILSSLAAPSFREMIAAQRARAAVSAVNGALWLARSEAIKRNAPVGFSLPGLDAPWDVKTGTTVLHTEQALPAVSLTYKAPSVDAGTFRFNEYGRLAAGGGSVIELAVAQAGLYRCLSVSSTGRTEVIEGRCL
ncbi:MAG: GspH/FimT family pseudopilin [Betaproteobacteria bacterium]